MYSWRYSCWMPCWSGSSGLRGWLAARQAEEAARQVDGVVGQICEELVAGEVEVEVELQLQAVGGLTSTAAVATAAAGMVVMMISKEQRPQGCDVLYSSGGA